jgi:hypothetical protein
VSVRHVIEASAGLDAVTVLVHDFEPGKGQLIVECWGCAWSCFWGAMGEGRSVLQFLADTDGGYVANCLIRGRRQFISSRRHEDRELAYLTKICQAVIAYAETTRHAP